jgi:hypothetical protein
MRKLLAGLFFVYLLITGLNPARAQSSALVSLYDLQSAAFPVMTVGLDVFDATGNLVTGLTAETVTLFENNQPRPITHLEELHPGVKFALALDPGPTFAYRDANAVTRFDKVLRALKEWAAAQPDSLGDDLSLVPNGGPDALHLAQRAAFSDALTAYQPNLITLTSSPDTLSRAMDTVSASPLQAGGKPVVLYITSIPTASDVIAIQGLAQRAAAQHIRVHTWIVASQDYFSTSGVTALKDLAIQTGGQFFLFSGKEPLPNLEDYLAPLRHSYRLEYSSNIFTSGGYALSAQVTLNGEPITSEALLFELDVQPPNPILLAPPAQIVRTAQDEHTSATAAYLPTRQPISIIIEFPDGRKRPLVRTSLYVDGVLVDDNTVEPFDQFSWDLSGYALSGEHILTVEAMDNLGLSKVSLGLPVLVTVVRPPAGILPWLSRNSLWVAMGAILVAGGGGLAAILATSRLKKSSTDRGSRADLMTQPVPGGAGTRGLRLLRASATKSTEAYLVRLKGDGIPITSPEIPITIPEMIFGSDPIKATRVLDDPSVSPLHARIKVEQGEYILSDENSTAGTWINFEQVTTPRQLQHGDMLHIGRISYRFMLRKPPDRPSPRVIPTTR